MLSASVSNIDLFHMWRGNEDLDVGWLLNRLSGAEPETEQMKAGKAFHKILEAPDFEEQTELTINFEGQSYWFSIQCDIILALPAIRELSVEYCYGDLLVRGRVDGLDGNRVIDYKTTAQFDADRLMEGYQWRFYLDMLGANSFTWKVFVLSQYGQPGHYDVIQTHDLTQYRYPGLHEDCVRLAATYCEFTKSIGFAKEKEISVG
jgi:hypothetical protein